MTLPAALPVVIERQTIEEFFDRVVASPDWFAGELAGRTSEYDFLPFEKRPVIHFGDELLVLDETYLLNKIASGTITPPGTVTAGTRPTGNW